MTQTLRRELRQGLDKVYRSSRVYSLAEFAMGEGTLSIDEQKKEFERISREFLDALADAALEVRGIAKATLPAGSDLGFALAAGISSEQIARDATQHEVEKAVIDLYEFEMGYNPLDWYSDNDLKGLLRFLVSKSSKEISAFAAWSKRPFSTFDPVKAKRFPKDVIAFWPLAFVEKSPEPPPVIVRAEDDDNRYVPNPNPRKR